MAATRDVGRAKTGVEEEATRAHDVFLSHSSEDKAAVEQVARGLKRSGVKPWLDKWEIAPGARWQDELAAALRSVRACAVFVGPAGIGDWEQQELGLALDRAAKEPSFRVFPVLLPGVADPFDPTSLPPFLSTRSWVDMRAGTGDPDALDELVRAVTGSARRVAPEGQATILNPYVGLRAFDADDALFFFGRAGDTQVLLERLKAARFLAVLGPSGSGKSSLVRAGLLPALKDEGLPGSGSWRVEVIRPGAEPLTALAARLTDLFPKRAVNTTLDSLAADHRSLHLLVAASMSRAAEGERVLWIVDQFEEVFTTCRNEPERASFIANLLYAAAAPQGRNVIVTTMRADFYPHCAEFPELARAVASHQYLVPQLTAEGFAQVIERPAAVAGLELVEGLTDALLRDVVDQPGGLPLLQHTLFELWRRRTGKVLTLDSYRDLGGVAGSLARAAEEIYEALSEEQRDIARRTFLRLTQPGEGTEDTRRRARLEELSSSGRMSEVDDVVSRFTEARLVTSDLDEHGRPTLEVAHEALLRGWPRLKRWLDDGRAALIVHRRLTEAVHEWEAHDRHPDFLLAGTRLAEAEELAEADPEALNELEQEFIEVSVDARAEAERRRKGRTRIALASLTVGLATVLVIAAIALAQKSQADRQGELALSRQVAAEAVGQLEIDPELSLLLAREAYRIAPTAEAEASLRRALGSAFLEIRLVGDPVRPSAAEAFFAPDGSEVVTTGSAGARTWDASTGVELTKLGAGSVYSVAYSPKGDMVLSAGQDTRPSVWEAKTGKLIARLSAKTGLGAAIGWVGGEGKVGSLERFSGEVTIWDASSGEAVRRFAHDGAEAAGGETRGYTDPSRRRLAITSAGVSVWEVDSGKKLLRLLEDELVTAGSFDPTGRYLVTATDDGDAIVWDTGNGGRLGTLSHVSRVAAAKFSPSGDLIATAEGLGDVRIWRWREDKVEQILSGHLASVGQSAMTWSDDGSLLITGSSDGTVRVWDVASGAELATLYGHEGRVESVAIDPSGKRILTTASDGARIWRLPASSSRELGGHQGAIYSLSYSTDGSRFMSADDAGIAIVWDVGKDYKKTQELKTGLGFPVVDLSPDGSRAATSGFSFKGAARPKVWNASTGKLVGTIPVPKRESPACFAKGCSMVSVKFSPDGSQLATTQTSGHVDIWDANSYERLRTIKDFKFWAIHAAWSPDSRRLVVGGREEDPHVFDVASGKRLFELRGHTEQQDQIAFSPDGELVASGGFDSTARLWDAQTGDELAVLRPGGRVSSLSFSPDGKFLVTGGVKVTVWDVRSGTQLTQFGSEASGVPASVAFAPDGRIAVGWTGGTLRIYACELCAPIEKLIETVDDRVTRSLTPIEKARLLDED